MSSDLKDSASLLGSRICHDLISPLGAISNGLELLAMTGMEKTPELALIEESIENANAKVRFFRVALGAASSTQVLARSEILKLLAGAYQGERLKLRWHVPSDPSRTDAKQAFLAIMCMETVLPQGGEIVIAMDRGQWQFQAYGPKIKFDTHLWTGLAGKAPLNVTSSQVQFLLLRDAFTTLGQEAQVGHSDSAVSLRF